MINRLISVAPMMDCTDRHARYFLRLIAPTVLLYTEMVTTGALIYGDAARFLRFDPLEHPIALQLGGNEPKALAIAAKMGEAAGYDEVNLNVGCPSARVKSGCFGASLMLEPERVAACIEAMQAVVSVPVTVKCRIGVDHRDSYEELSYFINTVMQAGCTIFVIHARKALLNGLSPKQNREIPPLRYEVVRKIKADFPSLTIIINGGIKTVADVETHLQSVDGVMIGREAYSNPYFLAALQKTFLQSATTAFLLDRKSIIDKFIPYVETQLREKEKLSNITRHILGLFHGEKGARAWRRHLTTKAHNPLAGVEIITEALQYV